MSINALLAGLKNDIYQVRADTPQRSQGYSRLHLTRRKLHLVDIPCTNSTCSDSAPSHRFVYPVSPPFSLTDRTPFERASRWHRSREPLTLRCWIRMAAVYAMFCTVVRTAASSVRRRFGTGSSARSTSDRRCHFEKRRLSLAVERAKMLTMHSNVVEWVQESGQRWLPDSESQGGRAPATLARVAGLKYAYASE